MARLLNDTGRYRAGTRFVAQDVHVIDVEHIGTGRVTIVRSEDDIARLGVD